MFGDPRFTDPLYTIATAAWHLGMSPSGLAKWVDRDGLLTTLPGAGREPRLPFIALAEAQFYRQLRKAHLSMQAISTGMRMVRRELGDRMLERGVLAHDGKDILMNLAGEGDADWERARDRQGGLPKVIEIGLQPIQYTHDDLPGRVRLTLYEDVQVVADPAYAFGQPIIRDSGVRVEDVFSLYKAGESVANVAKEMGVSAYDVDSIIRPHVAAMA